MSLIGKCNLILEISESIIYRSCREHQYLCLNSSSHDILEELLVSRYFIFAWRIVSEVMRLIDNHKVIVSPVDTREIYTIGFSSSSSEVCMIKYIIVESILYERIVFIVIEECEPVISELLWTEYKNAFISFLIVLDNSEC